MHFEPGTVCLSLMLFNLGLVAYRASIKFLEAPVSINAFICGGVMVYFDRDGQQWILVNVKCVL